MTPEEMLKEPEKTWLEWVDPWEGLDHENKPVLVTVVMRATVADCIKIRRRGMKFNPVGKDMNLSDMQLLCEFMAVHWAWHANTTIINGRVQHPPETPQTSATD